MHLKEDTLILFEYNISHFPLFHDAIFLSFLSNCVHASKEEDGDSVVDVDHVSLDGRSDIDNGLSYCFIHVGFYFVGVAILFCLGLDVYFPFGFFFF